MYTFANENGDFVLDGGDIKSVYGGSMIAQELSTWLREPLGSDIHHTDFGSKLPEYIGTPIYGEMLDDVEAEVYRIINDFALYYKNKYQNDSINGIKRYNPEDIIRSIDYVSFDEGADSLTIKVGISTFNGTVTVTKVI